MMQSLVRHGEKIRLGLQRQGAQGRSIGRTRM